MNERISALMDGELQDADMDRSLGHLKSDVDLRRAWNTYHLIGDALRGHVAPGFAARVSQRLAAEPTVLAPAQKTGSSRLPQIALSAAAGVAGIAMVAWLALPALQSEPQQLAVSAPPAVTASSAPPGAVGAEGYLLAHQRFSHTSAMQGVAPYARTVADEREGGSK
jgi:sigma-E factor negative regulatory protein RseA